MTEFIKMATISSLTESIRVGETHGFIAFEKNDTAAFVTGGEIISCRIEFDSRDDVRWWSGVSAAPRMRRGKKRGVIN